MITRFEMEQLWASYAGQTERLRHYKEARVDAMTGHFGNVKDNYNAQVHASTHLWAKVYFATPTKNH